MPCTSSSSPFTTLVQPASTVSTTLPAEFDPGTAYLLGQCCALTYAQFDSGTISTSDFAGLELLGSLAGYSLQAAQLTAFTVSEESEPGPTVGDVGDYYPSQGGFGVQLTLTKEGAQTHTWTVIALRGTRTFAEWLQDATALPVPFAPGSHLWQADGQGSVHSGFYGDYTTGTDGTTVPGDKALGSDPASRAAGSLAAQVGTYLSALGGADVYVTGHSLGGALATLCAMDIALNFSPGSLTLYALASPRVAVGLSDSWGVPIPTVGNQAMFVQNFQSKVPNTFQIVHAADIVPILPPIVTTAGALTITCAHVTDPWQGSGATATAVVTGGQVTAVEVTSAGSGYLPSSAPPVAFSGGEGWGAAAQATVGTGWLDSGTVTSVSIENGGYEYTAAPTVAIGESGSGLCANVVSFCAQTGDIGNNHGCLNTYVPYLQALATSFS